MEVTHPTMWSSWIGMIQKAAGHMRWTLDEHRFAVFFLYTFRLATHSLFDQWTRCHSGWVSWFLPR